MTRSAGWAARLWAGLKLAWGLLMMPLALLIIAGVLDPASKAAGHVADRLREREAEKADATKS